MTVPWRSFTPFWVLCKYIRFIWHRHCSACLGWVMAFCCCCKEWHLLALPPSQRQVNRFVQLVWRTRQWSEWWHHLPPPYSIIWRGNVGAQRHGVCLKANPGTLASPQSLGWKSAIDRGFVRQESLREQFGSVCVCWEVKDGLICPASGCSGVYPCGVYLKSSSASVHTHKLYTQNVLPPSLPD